MPGNFYNPFNEIFESKDYPHSRTLRTGFFKKLSDAYLVFYGEFSPYDREIDHVGLFDYLTLGIPYSINKIATWAKQTRSRNALTTLLPFPIHFIAVALSITRVVIAAVLTILTFPITLMVNSIAWAISKPMKAAVLKMKIESSSQTVEQYLIGRKLSLDDLNEFNWVVVPKSNSPSEFNSIPLMENEKLASKRISIQYDKDGIDAGLRLGFKFFKAAPIKSLTTPTPTNSSLSKVI